MKLFQQTNVKTLSVLIFALFAIGVGSVITSDSAFAATRTWVGGTDELFSTTANWTGGTVPVNGDSIVLGGANSTFNNDISNLSLVGITYNGSGSDPYLFGNSINIQGTIIDSSASSPGTTVLDVHLDTVLSGNLTVSNSLLSGTTNLQSHTLSINNPSVPCTYLGTLAGTGQLNMNTVLGQFSRGASFTGPVNITGGEVRFPVLDGGAAQGSGISVSGAASLVGLVSNYRTLSEALTLSGSGHLGFVQVNGVGDDCSYTSRPYDIVALMTLAGGVTLQSDFSLSGINHAVVTGPYVTNGHTVTSIGTGLFVSNVTQIPFATITANDSQPSVTTIAGYNQTLVLNGVRSGSGSAYGGILKGTGTALDIGVTQDAIVAPGNSPGKLTALNSLTLAGTYQAELLNNTTYDQLAVGQDYAGSDAAVVLYAGAVLDVSLYDGWSIRAGDSFRIIDNLSSTAVDGTFTGLSEGSQLTVGGIVFSISYVGGDGNDVVLTALNTGVEPGAPNTGAMKLVLGNPLVVAGLGLITAIFLVYLAVRRRNDSR